MKKFAAGLTLAAFAVGAPVAYATGNGDHKVTLCHKGKQTITVDKHAAKEHVKHGDSYGKCKDEPTSEPTKDPEPPEEPTSEPEPSEEPTTSEPTEEPEPEPEPTETQPTEEPTEEPEPSTPTETEEPSSTPEPSETSQPKPDPSPSASETSEPKPNKTATRPPLGTSKKPSGHGGSSKKSAPQKFVDNDANGKPDITVNADGSPIVQEGF